VRFPGIAGGLVERDEDGVLGDRVLGDRTDGEAAGAGCSPDVPHAASATRGTNAQGRQRSTRPALGLPIREMRARCVTERDYRPWLIRPPISTFLTLRFATVAQDAGLVFKT
jgi:hypothetical protein